MDLYNLDPNDVRLLLKLIEEQLVREGTPERERVRLTQLRDRLKNEILYSSASR